MEDSDTMICHSTDNTNLITLLVMMKIKINHVRLTYFVDINNDSEIYTMKLFSSMFVLKTAELRRLTVTAVNGILYDVQLFVENALKTWTKDRRGLLIYYYFC